jgi:hypothetical protein
MKLPDAEAADVDLEKVTDYLLNPTTAAANQRLDFSWHLDTAEKIQNDFAATGCALGEWVQSEKRLLAPRYQICCRWCDVRSRGKVGPDSNRVDYRTPRS